MKNLINFIHLCRRFYKITKKKYNIDNVFFQDYHDLEDKYYDREEFILNLCDKKRVLHIGFLDSPFCEEKVLDKTLLHTKIAQVSSYLYGIDIDNASLDKYRLLTYDKNNKIYDLGQPIDHDDICNIFNDSFDIVLLGEVLEHLKNPGIALNNILNICKINNSKLCVTVPNAFFLMGFCAALNSSEIVHPDHYYYFSPSTLSKLLKDAEFKDININFYISKDMEHMPGIIKNGIIATCRP